jgi:LysR family transcriptional regulator, glycine cleavage system transcriptional activator
MSQLPLRSIEAFVVVARAGNLAQAAARLNITVPAVSRRIQILERYLGAKLFDRQPRGLSLTEAGAKYFSELGPAWDCVWKATIAATSVRRDAFKVSVIPTFAANWLVPRLARSRLRLAGLEVEIETSPDIVELRERDDLDCAIRLGLGPWPGAVGQMILPIKAYPVASPDFVARERLKSPTDLARQTLIGSSHQPDFWPEWFRHAGIGFGQGPLRSFDNLQLVYEAAAAGLGAAIGLDPLVRPYLDSGRLLRLWPDDVTLSRSFHLVRRADCVESNRFDLFRNWLMGEAAAAA